MLLSVTALVLVGSIPVSSGTTAYAGSAGQEQTCVGRHWVASWAAAPTDGLVNQPPLHQTFRIRVLPHRDGSVARLRFSNKFGLGTVTFGAVTIGHQSSGATLKPGSLREVTFGGQKHVRIARGAEVVSDPVKIRVRAFRSLLASVYVLGAPGPATQHVLAGQSSWQSAPLSGDATRSLSGSSFIALPVPGLTPAIPQGIAYLNGFDVLTSKRVGTVVAFGDSITDGFQGVVSPILPVSSNIDLDSRYPDLLARRVLDAGLNLSVVNAGISGNQLLKDSPVPIFGRSGLSRLQSDALDQPGVTTVILMEGINDIGQSFASPAKLIAGYQSAIAQAHAHDVRILLGTLTPDEGTLQPGYGFMGEAARSEVNDWIRSQDLSDGFVDFDAAVRDPAHPTRILPAYDGGDHLHFSPAGYAALAAAVPLDALHQPRCG